MNIVEVLDKKKATANLKYYGKDDFASGFQIRTLVDCKDDIICYYSGKRNEIRTIDDYIDFLFLNAHVALDEVLPIVREDIKEEVSDTIEKLKEIKSGYKNSEFNRFIKKKYEIILSPSEHKNLNIHAYEILEYTLEYIKSNFQIFKNEFELYKYIVEKYAYRIFYCYGDYRSIFEKYPQLLEIMFSEDILKNQMSTKIEDLEEGLKVIKKSNKELYKKSIEYIVNMIKKRSFNTNKERVMNTYIDVKEARKLLQRIGDNYFREFDEELQRQEEILNIYLHENGHQISYEVNIQDVIKKYEDINETWEIKSLALTHGKNNNIIQSRITTAVESREKRNLVDIAYHMDRETNDYFPYSTQTKLMLTVMYGKLMLKYMLSDEKRHKELINYMFAGIANYIEKNNIEIPNIDDDFNMLNYSLKVCIECNSSEEKDELICRLNNYNTIHLVIGIIEKILRELFYRYIGVNKYIPQASLTLEKMLRTEEMENFLGQANVRSFSFFLTSFDNTGKELRNDIAHYNNNIKDICTMDNVFTVLYLLITLTNELLLKVIKS